jgi:D-aspartate ligase
MHERIPAFVLGGSLCGLHLCRSLGRQGVPVTLFERGSADVAFASRYCRAVALPEHASDADVMRAVVEAATKIGSRPPLLIATDRMLRLASRGRDELGRVCRLRQPDDDRVETVLDKSRFARFTAANDIPVPATFVPEGARLLSKRAPELAHPVILKPFESTQWDNERFKVAFGSVKAVRTDSPDETVARWSAMRELGGPMLVQESIPGPDDQNYSYISHRDALGNENVGMTVRKLRIHPVHAGIGCAIVGVRDDEIDALGRRVAAALGWIGVSSVCVKRDARSGVAKVYEVNGRFPMPHPVFQLCGVDLPYLVYQSLLDEKPAWPRPRFNGRICIGASRDFRAAWTYWRNRETSLGAWLGSLLRTRQIMEFSLDDPAPLFARALQALAHRRRRKTVASSASVTPSRPAQAERIDADAVNQ